MNNIKIKDIEKKDIKKEVYKHNNIYKHNKHNK